MPPIRLLKIGVGLVYTFVGLVLFFVGVKGGFIPAGAELGGMVARMEHNGALIPLGFLLGAVVVCAEPAVWVLNAQVEQVSGGHIRKNIMLASLSIGIIMGLYLSRYLP